jgi:hypothetical protein
MRDDPNPERTKMDEKWCDTVARSVVDELLVAKLIASNQADWARRIVSQDIFIQLVSGVRAECRPGGASSRMEVNILVC